MIVRLYYRQRRSKRKERNDSQKRESVGQEERYHAVSRLGERQRGSHEIKKGVKRGEGRETYG